MSRGQMLALFFFSSDFGELSMPKPKIVEANDDVVEW